MNVVAVTSCLTGVAHTYIAAEAIEKAFKIAGHKIKVETQGSIGIGNKLISSEIRDADYVILTKDIAIEEEYRFRGKVIVRVAVTDAIRKTDLLVKKLEQKYSEKII